MTTLTRFTVRFRTLSLFDRRALIVLQEGRCATCDFARACGLAETSAARTMLRRLERWGLVEGVRASGGRTYWWQITDPGRNAIGVGAGAAPVQIGGGA